MTFVRKLRLFFICVLQFVDRFLSRFDPVAQERIENRKSIPYSEYIKQLDTERAEIYTELNRRNLRILSFNRDNYTELAKSLIAKFQAVDGRPEQQHDSDTGGKYRCSYDFA